MLPHPPDGQFRHLVLLGAPRGLAEQLMEVGLARRVSQAIPADGSADAAVVLGGRWIAPQTMAGCLVEGGVLYQEVERAGGRALAWTPNRLRRTLRRSGFSTIGLYAVVPELSNHRLYLPLDVPGCLRWYVTTLRSALTPWQQLLQTGLRAATNLDGRRFGLFAPRLAVTAVTGRGRSSLASVLGHSSLPGELGTRELKPLLLTAGGDRVVMLPFGADSTEPVAVLKVPRSPAFNSRTENEQAALGKLWSTLDFATRASLPQPLGVLRYGEVTVGVESYVPGQLLARSCERWTASLVEKLNDLRLAAAWLAGFYAQAQVSRRAWGAAELEEWLDGPIDAYRRAFGVTGAEERLFAKAREYGVSLSGSPFPLVCQHRDFTVWNIVRSGRRLAVLDWEGSRVGPALTDLLHFVTHWYETMCHAHDETSRQRCFRRLVFEPARADPFHEAAHVEITRYLARLGMDRAILPILLLYTWIELALRRWDQQRAQGEAGCGPREGNRNLPFVAILAAHADLLFAPGDPVDGRLRP